MTVYLRAQGVHLELPVDLQRVGDLDAPSGFLATLGGTERRRVSVLAGIEFDAREGDRIGVLGLNGAGKTTLLRVLNGAFPPTRGVVRHEGSMQSLLNSTLGFEEYASVSENVFLRGTAIGLRRRQLEAALPGILAFAGLGDRASHRLHVLSSGQRTRLGFAISTAIQPDILLMDEWIATGDDSFIKRAQERLLSRFNNSRIVVLASHSTQLIRELCNKALVLDAGRVRFFGDVRDGIEVYRTIVSQVDGGSREQLATADPLLFAGDVGIVERIRLGHGVVEVEGWAVAHNGAEIGAICIELDGQRSGIETFERVDRSDVRLHLAKGKGHFGFRACVHQVTDATLTDIASRMRVSVGASAKRLGPPLPLARAGVLEQV